MSLSSCPFCKQYGFNEVGLDILTTEEGDIRWYRCKNKDLPDYYSMYLPICAHRIHVNAEKHQRNKGDLKK